MQSGALIHVTGDVQIAKQKAFVKVLLIKWLHKKKESYQLIWNVKYIYCKERRVLCAINDDYTE